MNEIIEVLSKLKTTCEIDSFLNEILTEKEINTLSKRWRILKMLACGDTQRDIAKKLNVSLCKITRGAKILKNKKAIVTKYLIKE